MSNLKTRPSSRLDLQSMTGSCSTRTNYYGSLSRSARCCFTPLTPADDAPPPGLDKSQSHDGLDLYLHLDLGYAHRLCCADLKELTAACTGPRRERR